MLGHLLEAFFFIICSRFIAEDAVLILWAGADLPELPLLLDDDPEDFDEDGDDSALGTVLVTGDDTDDLELDLCDIPAGIVRGLVGLVLLIEGLTPVRLAAMPARPVNGCLFDVPLGDTVCVWMKKIILKMKNHYCYQTKSDYQQPPILVKSEMFAFLHLFYMCTEFCIRALQLHIGIDFRSLSGKITFSFKLMGFSTDGK